MGNVMLPIASNIAEIGFAQAGVLVQRRQVRYYPPQRVAGSIPAARSTYDRAEARSFLLRFL
jgi:hypothetical protein